MKFDEIGNWTEVKLEIIREYASAYSRILAAQTNPRLSHAYIDAFSGAGINISRNSGDVKAGSPVVALGIIPPFKDYYFIDIDQEKVEILKKVTEGRDNVHIYPSDCNAALLNEVFPKVKFEDYRRALCLLDPYGLHLDWEIIATAAKMKSIEIFINFPVMDMNRNVLWKNPEGVTTKQINRMNAFWGDATWRDVAYDTTLSLFGFPVKADNETIASAFKNRLMKKAGFLHVPDPIPMRNSKDATLYYLFFASQKPVADEIVTEIFTKYRKKGEIE
jgi:three-Cys-motif partner protein